MKTVSSAGLHAESHLYLLISMCFFVQESHPLRGQVLRPGGNSIYTKISIFLSMGF